MEHSFTEEISKILEEDFREKWKDIFDKSSLLQYINLKTRSANKGSKSRSSFANLYAIYVLVEDYLSKGFNKNEGYSTYEGAQFAPLLERIRKLPFGEKMQNHALNNRMNDEYKKYFQQSEYIPIMRDLATKRYWINENLLKIDLSSEKF
ncbi:hypothetical protein QEH53_23610, partial [Pelagicoccus sp. SDUM812002]